MKPIEEGCLAVIVRSSVPENIGKSVRVGKFVGTPPVEESENVVWDGEGLWWEIDRSIISNYGDHVYYAREDYLIRIDGLDETIDEQMEETV